METLVSRTGAVKVPWSRTITNRRSGTRFRGFIVAIARGALRDERVEELSCGMRHVVHGASERELVRLRGPREPAQLSDELQRRRPDLIVRSRWCKVVQRLDASTHGNLLL